MPCGHLHQTPRDMGLSGGPEVDLPICQRLKVEVGDLPPQVQKIPPWPALNPVRLWFPHVFFSFQYLLSSSSSSSRPSLALALYQWAQMHYITAQLMPLRSLTLRCVTADPRARACASLPGGRLPAIAVGILIYVFFKDGGFLSTAVAIATT